MPNIRRGVALGESGDSDCAALAKGAVMESRNGNDRAMPAPCRKRRREIDRREEMNGAPPVGPENGFMGGLLRLEQITLYNSMHEGAQPKLPSAGKLDDIFDLLAVGESHWRACSIRSQLPCEIARQE